MREVIEYRDNARRPCRIHSSIGSLSAEPRKVRRKGRKGASFGARSVFDSYLGRGSPFENNGNAIMRERVAGQGAANIVVKTKNKRLARAVNTSRMNHPRTSPKI